MLPRKKLSRYISYNLQVYFEFVNFIFTFMLLVKFDEKSIEVWDNTI